VAVVVPPPFPSLSSPPVAVHTALLLLRQWATTEVDEFDSEMSKWLLRSQDCQISDLKTYYLDEWQFVNLSVGHQWRVLLAMRAIRERFDELLRLQNARDLSDSECCRELYDLRLTALVLLTAANLDSERWEAVYQQQVYSMIEAITELGDEELENHTRKKLERQQMLRYLFNLG